MSTCKVCNGSDFYKSGRCKACANAANRKFYAKNIDAERSRSIAYGKSNPGKGAARTAKWNAKNPDKIKKAKAAYYSANKDRFKTLGALWARVNFKVKRIHAQNRRARKRLVGGVLSSNLASKLYALQRGRCACCGSILGGSFHLDHRIPLALGGSNSDQNMQLLAPVCNLQKHAQDPIDFMRSRGFLI